MVELLRHPVDGGRSGLVRLGIDRLDEGAAEPLAVGGEELQAAQAVDVGHKLARRAIAPGDKILKYGAPIGSATRAIMPGEWVHVHNMKSDYIPSHDRQTISGGKA